MTFIEKGIVAFLLTTVGTGQQFNIAAIEKHFGGTDDVMNFVESIEGTLIEGVLTWGEGPNRYWKRVTEDPLIIARFRLECRQ